MTLPGEGDPSGIEPDYHQIDRQTETGLLTEALAQNPELKESATPFVLMTLDGRSPYSNVARALECKIFNEYFQNDEAEMAAEYGPYESQSLFFLMIRRDNLEPAGVMRLIRPSEAGFKSVNDLPTDKCKTPDGRPVTQLTAEEILPALAADPSKTLDVATIAANPPYGEKATGSPVVLAALMRALHQYTHANNYDELVAIIDAVPLKKLRDVGLPTDILPQVESPFVYLGAEGNSFVRIHVPRVDTSVSAKNQLVFDYVFGDANLFGECDLSLFEQ